MREEILLNGLQLEPTVTAIKEIASKNDIDIKQVNYINISVYNDNTACVWLINYDKKRTSDQWHYFNNNKGFEMPIFKETNINYLKNIFNLNKARLGENYKTANGYYFIKLANNKPSLLDLYKSTNETDFICFIAWDGYNFKTFTRLDNADHNFEYCYMRSLGYTFNKTEASKTRKNALEIYALHCTNLIENEIIYSRHYDRQRAQQDNAQKIFFTRYKIKDIFGYSKNGLSLSYYGGDYRAYGFNAFQGARINGYNLVFPREIMQDHEKQKEFIIKNAFDKSGYFVLDRREKLREKADKIKREKALNEWHAKDKTQYIKKINNYLLYLVNRFDKVLSLIRWSKVFLLHHLSEIKDLFNTLTRIKENITNEKYNSQQDLERTLNSYIAKIDMELLLTNDKNINNEKLGSYSDYEIIDNEIIKHYSWSSYDIPQRGE